MNTSTHFKTFLWILCCLLCTCTYAQTPEYVPGRVLVKMKSGKSIAQKKTLKERIGATSKKRYSKSKVELWEIDTQSGKDVVQIIDEYKDHPDIAYIEPDYIIELAMSPDEFCSESEEITPEGLLFNDQWALSNVGQSGGNEDIDIDAPEAWNSISTSPLVKVAVIDTGIDWGHEDLVDNIWQNLGEDADGDGHVLEYNTVEQKWEFDEGDENGIDDDGNGYADDFVGWDFADGDNNPFDDYDSNPNDPFVPAHGTHVAGIIGAKGDNDFGIAGVTWNVQMAALKIFGEDAKSCSDAIEAIDYAVSMGFPISNNSWGLNTCDGLSYSLYDAIEVARDSGHLFVAASGNTLRIGDPRDNDNYATYPASYDLDNIISVTAIDRYGSLWYRAHYGANTVDVGAPGLEILSTSTEYNGYTNRSGTSMAAPHVTGACALLWGLYHDKTYTDIKTTILDTAVPTPSLYGKCQTNGRLNLHNAITGFTTPPPPSLPSLCRAADSLALLQLKSAADAISTTKWSAWDPMEPIDTWYGVGLDANGCVDSLYLHKQPYYDTLTALPAEIGNLTNLRTLTLNYLGMVDIPPEIGHLKNLEILNLGSNDLTVLPLEIENLNRLRILNLTSNDFTNFPQGITTLTTLEELYVNAWIQNIPNSIGQLTNLKKLNLSGNRITLLPSEIGNLTQLNELYLSSNRLTSLPPEIGNLTNLKELNIASNTIGSLPTEVSDLRNLEILDYRYNQLTSLSPNIGSIPNLKNLNLYNNDLINLPAEIGNLSNLEYLNVGQNQLTTLPNEISGLSNLISFDLYYNKIVYLPYEIGDLSSLYRLNLRVNELNTLPTNIGNLVGLEELYLGDNKLTSLPSEIGNLINLDRLNLGVNQLSYLPPTMANMSDLQILNLSHNQLNSIPAWVGNLKKLYRFWFNDNQATSCFDENLINLCAKLLDHGIIYSPEYHITAGNNFPFTWDEFCNAGSGICALSGCRQSDSLALVAIRDNTVLGSWFSWNVNQPINNWSGVTLNGLGCVIDLDLSDKDIIGQIAPEIGNLTYLESLDLSGNYFDGSIPLEIGGLTKLQALNLSDNRFEGTIPDELGDLSELRYLNLSENKLAENIPASLGNYLKIRTLDLSDNLLTGNIPIEFGNLRQLLYLYLSDNLLTSSIPDAFGRLSLRKLHLNNNRLSGSIPYTLTNLKWLDELWLNDNNLDGCFYTGLGVLCDRLSDGFSTNGFISDGNNFSETWEDFCNRGENICEPVRPGDFNYDGIANEEDVLSWALSYEFSGPPRQGTPTTNWRNHDAEEWQSTTLDKNSKHQDGDGNGIVDFGDLSVLEMNFGKTHGLGTPLNVNANTEYDFLRVGDSGDFDYELFVRNEDSSYVELHGLSFTFDFGNLEVDEVIVDLTNSSLQPDTMFTRFDTLRNRWHFAVTRTSGTDQICIGPVAQFSIVISKNIPSGEPTKIMSIENGTQMTTNGVLEDMGGLSIYGSSPDAFDPSQIVLGAFVIHSQCDTQGEISLEVGGGFPPYTYSWSNGANTSDIGNLQSGIYQVTVTDSVGVEGTATIEVENHYLPVYDGEGNLIDCNTVFSSPNLHVILEGPYNPANDTMRTSIQQLDTLPEGRHPYTQAPWNYAGLEGLNWTLADYPNYTVDWVLVSFRTDITRNTQIAQAAAILHKDGSLYFPDGAIRFTGVADSVYVIVEHRNHIGVMTPQPIPIANMTYDFRLGDSYKGDTGTGQKQLSNGKWAMLAGDCNQIVDIQSYDINGQDKVPWVERNGHFRVYAMPDFNLDGDVNGEDKIFWEANNGKSSRVPK